ncbi:MAG: energy-coupling factor transporter transmembrane protein EcfT [Anaerolineae bacterium]|nr:energy-coupling factor transporter transmembrane protein EcfT [Anaerolineae bacterium]
MSLLYDLYQPGDSWLHRLDPRVKFIFVLCASLLLLLMRSLWVMLIALVGAQLILLSGGISWRRIGWVWRMTLPTMVLIAVLWVIFYPGEGQALLSWRFLRITPYNIAEGLAVALRIGALAFILFIWLFSTSQSALIRGLVALGLPYTWGLTLAMALRYLPTMAGIFQLISDAQRARALELDQGNPLRRARAHLPIVVAMLITALRTAQNLSLALASRAFGAQRKRTHLHPLHFRPLDGLLLAGILLATAALLWARLALGLGQEPL